MKILKTIYYICLTIIALMVLLFCLGLPWIAIVLIPVILFLYFFPFALRRSFEKKINCDDVRQCNNNYACQVIDKIRADIALRENMTQKNLKKIEILYQQLEAEKQNIIKESTELDQKRESYNNIVESLATFEKELAKMTNNMNGELFEKFCGYLLVRTGWKDITYTPASNDYGADIIAVSPDEVRVCIQCKRYNEPVGIAAVQEVFSAIQYYKCQAGMVMTNSTFTDNARKLANADNIILVDKVGQSYPKTNKFMNTANTQTASQPVIVSNNTVISNNTLNASAISILFHRPKNKRECLSVMTITVDDSVKLQLKNGASHPLSLSPGVHSVKAKLMPFTYKTEFIVENTPLTVECMVLDNSKPHITIK